PISLNVAYQIRDFLTAEHLRSIIVVTSGFRSQRSSLVYHAVLDPVGIKVSCAPVFGQKTPANWTKTWHGIQDVAEQLLKLQYYPFCGVRIGVRSRIIQSLMPALSFPPPCSPAPVLYHSPIRSSRSRRGA